MADAVQNSPRRTGLPILALCLALAAGGCQTTSLSDVTGSVGSTPPPAGSDEAHLRLYADAVAPRYAAHPDDKPIAMNYATALRGLTQHAQAVAVLQRLAVKNPHDMDVLAAYGKALADAGRLQEAQDVLGRSHTPERPNWSVLSAQGSVADQLGDHAGAQGFYVAALKIVPNQPQVLSNLGLSYALEHRLTDAEASLRRAVAQPTADMRERQNLALVLSLEGKDAEAESITRRDLPPIDAAESVASMKQMIAQSDTWKGNAAMEGGAQARKARTASSAVAKSSTNKAVADRAGPPADATAAARATRTAASDGFN